MLCNGTLYSNVEQANENSQVKTAGSEKFNTL